MLKFRYTVTHTFEVDENNYEEADKTPIEVEKENASEVLIMAIEEGWVEVEVEQID